jgi:hypothetical protein
MDQNGSVSIVTHCALDIPEIHTHPEPLGPTQAPVLDFFH